MKHIKYLIACLAMAAISQGALAQDTKIGILNPLRALFASDAAAVIQQELEAELAPDQERATELSEELNALAEEFQQNEAIMTEDEIRRMNSNAQDLQVQLQLIQERVQTALN
ncbi:MAG: OmpH family outer membrane protein, partial [Gammaproteobacteria bacterium]|nr:OmpH family outer membrane protein [Gammaproteobacteria bacterium]